MPTTITPEPTLKLDRSDFNRATAEEQEAIRLRVQELVTADARRRELCAGGGVDTTPITSGTVWRIAMAEYRLGKPQPIVEVDERQGKAACGCGWSASTLSRNGLTTSVRSHRRFHAGQRMSDRAHTEHPPFTVPPFTQEAAR